jgi:hypothetical protein
MKVSVTFEVGDEARIGIALSKAGELRPATRIECAEWLTFVGTSAIGEQSSKVGRVKARLLENELEPVTDAELTR